MTLKDVAKYANVSVSTVSKAINGAHDVSESTRIEILEIAEKLGYFSDKKRVRLENKNKNRFTVAVICPEIISMFYSEHVTFISKEVEAYGGNCVVHVYNFENDRLKKIIEDCDNDKNINAIICLNSGVSVKNTPLLTERSQEFKGSSSYSVEKALQYLESMGHKDIGFVGEKLTEAKEEVFVQCRGRNKAFVYKSNERFEEAGEEAAEYYVKNGLPSAVICAYDEIAYGLIDRLERLGVSVPEDVSVIGINNIKASKYCFGGVTTVETGWSETIKEAIERLYTLVVENKTDSIKKTIFKNPYVVERATVMPYKAERNDKV